LRIKTLFVLLAMLAVSAVMVGPASAAGPFASWSTPIGANNVGNGGGGAGTFQHLEAGTSDSGSGAATSLSFTVDTPGQPTLTIPAVGTPTGGGSVDWNADLDTRPYPNGTVLTLDMVATNAGGTSTPQPLTHTVQNSAPTAFWNPPVANTTNPLSLSVFVDATSFAATGVTFSVEGGASLGDGTFDGSHSYVIAFDPTQYSDGPITIDAIAHSDGAGNANSDSVVASRTYTILGPDVTDPVISGLMTPADNEVVSGNYILRVHATDDRGVVASGQYSIDGGQTWTQMQNQGSGNFLTHIDTTVFPNDSDLDVLYQVFDPTGNSDTADVLATVGNPAPPTIDPTSLVVTQNGSLDLSGPTQVGDFLYARDMTATGYPAPVITYTYRICTIGSVCTDVVTDGTYTIQFEDAGDFISLIAKATNASGTSSRVTQFSFIEFPVFVEPTGPQSGDGPQNDAPQADPTPAPATPVVTPPVVTPPVVTPPVVTPPVVTRAEQQAINVAQQVVQSKTAAVVTAKKAVTAATQAVKTVQKKVAAAVNTVSAGTATPTEKKKLDSTVATLVAAKVVASNKVAAAKAVTTKAVVAQKASVQTVDVAQKSVVAAKTAVATGASTPAEKKRLVKTEVALVAAKAVVSAKTTEVATVTKQLVVTQAAATQSVSIAQTKVSVALTAVASSTATTTAKNDLLKIETKLATAKVVASAKTDSLRASNAQLALANQKLAGKKAASVKP
jgi:hypothetical protein